MRQKKKQSGVFSVRANELSITEWKHYAQAAGISMTRMITDAMTEYVGAHPLTGYKLKVFEAMQAEYNQKMREAMKGNKQMTVREWIENLVSENVCFYEEHHNRHFSEEDKAGYMNELIEECVDGWDGTEDPLDDENEWWRDRTTAYVEEQTEKIVEYLSVNEDEADPEEE